MNWRQWGDAALFLCGLSGAVNAVIGGRWPEAVYALIIAALAFRLWVADARYR